LPKGANGFTTIGLTSSFAGTALKSKVLRLTKPVQQNLFNKTIASWPYNTALGRGGNGS
jgi:hypothetical protein